MSLMYVESRQGHNVGRVPGGDKGETKQHNPFD